MHIVEKLIQMFRQVMSELTSLNNDYEFTEKCEPFSNSGIAFP